MSDVGPFAFVLSLSVSAVPRMGDGHGAAAHERAVSETDGALRADQEERVALGIIAGHYHAKVCTMPRLPFEICSEWNTCFSIHRPTTDSSTTSVDKPDSTATAPPSTSLYRAPRPSARQQKRPGTAPPSTLAARDSKASSHRTESANQSVSRHRIGEGKSAQVAPSRTHPPQVKRNRRPQSQCRQQREWMRRYW